MKVLFDSYSTVMQNRAGGVGVKIKKTAQNLGGKLDVKLFDKWTDKIEDYDVLHIFKTSIDAYGEISYAKKKKVKVVVSATVNSEPGLKPRINRIIAICTGQKNSYAIIKKTLVLADAVICETEKEKDFVSRFFSIGKEKIFVIPCALDAKREDINAEYFRDNTGIQGKFILQVGRFDLNKNQLSTIKAVNGTDMQLVLIGGPDKDFPEYYDKCKEEAGDNVHFLGWVDHDDPLLASAYAAAHTFILPSYNETFGMVLFESGMYGCNIVVTKALPIKEWGMEKFCERVNPQSIKDIREKLELSYEKERTGEVSEIIERDFSWESVLKKYLDVYNFVLSKDDVR